VDRVNINHIFSHQKEYLEQEKQVNTKKPLVSVYVTAYQHEKYISKCLDSILSQRTNFPIEVVIGEDQSTDKTRPICIEYAEKHPDKIRLFLRNRKQTALYDEKGNFKKSINGILTLKACRGKYVAICEGDDYWTDPDKLQKQVDFLEANNDYILCFTNCSILEDDKITQVNAVSHNKDTFSHEDVPIYAPTLTLVFRGLKARELPALAAEVPGGDTFLLTWLSKFGKMKFLNFNSAVYRKHANGVWSGKTAFEQKMHLFDTRLAMYQIAKLNLRNKLLDHLAEILNQSASIISSEEELSQYKKAMSSYNLLIKEKMGAKPLKITNDIGYLVYADDILSSGIIRNQVIPLLEKLSSKCNYNITLISIILPGFSYDNHKLAEFTQHLNKYHIQLEIISEPQNDQILRDKLIKIVRSRQLSILHCRSYYATKIGLLVKDISEIKIIFDVRGLFPEEQKIMLQEKKSDPEKIEATYNELKSLESDLITGSDKVVVLNQDFKEHLKKDYANLSNLVEIKNFASLEKFKYSESDRISIRKELNWLQNKIFIYSGAFSPWYDLNLLAEWIRTLAEAIPDSCFIILNYQDANSALNPNMETLLQLSSSLRNRMVIRYVESSAIAAWLSASDVALIPHNPLYKEILRPAQPIKFAEFLANGLQIIASDYCGEIKHMLVSFPFIGYLVKEKESIQNFKKVLRQLLQFNDTKIREKISAVAADYAIELSVKAYSDLYQNQLEAINNTLNKNKRDIRTINQDRPLNILVITCNHGAVTQVRILSPFRELYQRHLIQYRVFTLQEEKEITHEDLEGVDIVIFQRIDFQPLIEVLRYARRQGILTIYEIDDNLFELPPQNPGYRHYHKSEVRKTIQCFLTESDYVTVSTPKLREYFQKYNANILTLPNQVDAQIYNYPHLKPSKQIRIGFAGTNTHQIDLAQVIPALKRIQKKYKERVKLVFINFIPQEFIGDPTVEFIPGMDFIPRYAKILADANLDIGIAPLRHNVFNRSKSDVKFLEYGISKIAGIYSKYDPYSQSVTDKQTGLLVETENPEEWYEKISLLIEDPTLRETLQLNAYNYVLNNRNFKDKAIDWFNLYQSLVKTKDSTKSVYLQNRSNAQNSAVTKIPLTSIIILTYNALEYTKKTINSILDNTEQPYEIVFVDNGSSDGTVVYLRHLTEQHNHIKLIENPHNRGFAAGNNQGAALAQGKYLLLLNNDVLVSPDWLTSLVKGLVRDPKIGLIGPMTNSISGRQRFAEINYQDDEGFYEFAQYVRTVNKDKLTPRRRIAGFAMLTRKSIFEQLGGFDESFGTGNFEDDDLCLRVRAAGYAIMVDESTFIHHYGSQTFKSNNLNYRQSIREKGQLFFKKWPNIDYNWLLEIKSSLADEHQEKLIQAEKYLENSNPSNAKEIYDLIIRENPLSCAALFGLAQTAYQTKDLKESTKILKRILQLYPDYYKAYNLLGVISYDLTQYQHAELLFKRALSFKPDDPDIHQNLGETLFTEHKFDEAQQKFIENVERFPDRIEPLLRMVQISAGAGNLEESAKYLQAARIIEPDSALISQHSKWLQSLQSETG
jgi:GT2 family glycosyltransferase/glycosyltransferase involved in cell wall biosynthesis/Flp pilus assembly protein TadD